MITSYYDLSIEQLKAKIEEIQKDAAREYDEWNRLSKEALIRHAKLGQKINDFSMKWRKQDLIYVLLDNSHGCKVRSIDKVIKAKQNTLEVLIPQAQARANEEQVTIYVIRTRYGRAVYTWAEVERYHSNDSLKVEYTAEPAA
jgi:hypothetical protein